MRYYGTKSCFSTQFKENKYVLNIVSARKRPKNNHGRQKIDKIFIIRKLIRPKSDEFKKVLFFFSNFSQFFSKMPKRKSTGQVPKPKYQLSAFRIVENRGKN